MQTAIRMAAVLVLVLSLGLNWALLQSVAWVSMVVQYSRNASFPEAISKALDGKHPCSLCWMIQKGRAAEKQANQKAKLKSGMKMDCVVVSQNDAFAGRPRADSILPGAFGAPMRHEQPPKPRPRRLSYAASPIGTFWVPDGAARFA